MFGAHPDPMAFTVVGLLVALSLSTYAQSLLGLDLGSGMTRYRLLPLDAGPGMTFGLAALALGHHSSLLLQLPHQRWRFTGGHLLPVGALQAVGGMALGFVEHERGLLLLAVAGYLMSLWYHGRRWNTLRESRQ